MNFGEILKDGKSLKKLIFISMCLLLSYWQPYPQSIYLTIYFFVTISLTFECLPLYFVALLTPVLLHATNFIFIYDYSYGFFRMNTFGVLISAIYQQPIKQSIVTKRLALDLLSAFSINLHTVLFLFLICSAFLSTFCPNYFVVFLLLPFIENVFEILALFDRRTYLGRNEKDIQERLKGFEMAFRMGLCLSSLIGSASSINNCEQGTIFQQYIVKSDFKISYSIWHIIMVPVSVVNLFILWLVLMIRYLGFKFAKSCLTSSLRDLVLCACCRKLRKEDKSYYKQLYWLKKDLGRFSWSEVVIVTNLIVLILLAFTRKSMIFYGWSDWVLIKWFKLFSAKDLKEVTFACIACLACFILFVTPNKRLSYSYPKKSSNPDSISLVSSDAQPILEWSTVSRSIPWTCIMCIGASNILLKAYYTSEVSTKLGVGISYYLNGQPPITAKLSLFILSILLTSFNLDRSVCHMMIPFSIHVARSCKIDATVTLLYSLVGTKFTCVSPFSNIPSLVMFSITDNADRIEFLKIGVLLTTFYSLVGIAGLAVGCPYFESKYDPEVLTYYNYEFIEYLKN